MFGQQVGRGGRRLSQTALRSQPQQMVTSRLQAGQRRCYAEASTKSTKQNYPPFVAGTGSKVGRGIGLLVYGVAAGGIAAGATWYSMMKQGLSAYSDADSLKQFQVKNDDAQRVEDHINNHPFVKELRARPDLTESRPHLKMSEQVRAKSLTGGTLLGDNMVVTPPYAWLEGGGKSFTSVFYLGDKLCGYPGLIHGGFLATLMDEALARSCFDALPAKAAVTAHLEIDYRKPSPANTYYVIKAKTVKVEGRKAWVEGHIETLVGPGETPLVVVEGKALFISPKYVKMLPRVQ